MPDGFVVPFAAHRAASDEQWAASGTQRAGSDGQRAASDGGWAASGTHPAASGALPALPAGLRAEVAARLAALGDPPVAVRSSASTEDTATASAAGQHDSFLGVRGAGPVTERIRACWASLWSDRATAYRRAQHLAPDPAMAVIVQRHIDAEVAGVLFTAGPDAGDQALIEASWGLGESVVHGLVTPDSWTVTPAGVARHATGDKATRIDRAPGGTVTGVVPAGDRRRSCLDDADVLRLAAMGRDMARVFGIPLDIEWALADGELWLLQARPITAAAPATAPPTTAAPEAAQPEGALPGAGRSAGAEPGAGGSADPVPATGASSGDSGLTLIGVPGSSGRAAGPARLVGGPGEFGRVRPGDVIVCRTTDPAWTPLFAVAAAVVTEAGGVLSHAAIVAREQHIPAVLGAPGAMTVLRDGHTVLVDGDTGAIHQP